VPLSKSNRLPVYHSLGELAARVVQALSKVLQAMTSLLLALVPKHQLVDGSPIKTEVVKSGKLVEVLQPGGQDVDLRHAVKAGILNVRL